MTARLRLACRLFLLAALVSGCAKREPPKVADFVGSWKSSRVSTPIRLYENGEWELLGENGKVRQYGVWQIRNGAMLWSYKVSGTIAHDENVLLSVSHDRFELKERDGATTTFVRLD